MNELSDEFGGVFIHSCGNFAHQLGNLEKVHNLRGLNFEASEMDFEHVWERFGGRTAIVVHLGLNKNIHFDSEADYVRHVLRTKTHDRGLCVLVFPPATSGSAPDSETSTDPVQVEVPDGPMQVDLRDLADLEAVYESDIKHGGLLVRTREAPAIDSEIMVPVLLPDPHGTIRCHGTVVKVNENPPSVAIRLSEIKFVRDRLQEIISAHS